MAQFPQGAVNDPALQDTLYLVIIYAIGKIMC